MLVMVVFFIAFRWIHLSTPLIRLFLLVLILLLMPTLNFLPFFFQAEDGIRDADVTGVQTCALPIWMGASSTRFSPVTRSGRTNTTSSRLQQAMNTYSMPGPPSCMSTEPSSGPVLAPTPKVTSRVRSEERRVGKERRATGAPGLDIRW